MPTTFIPRSEVRCGFGATALRCNYQRFGWVRVEGPRLDKLGRRQVGFTCAACRKLSPADSGVHSRGKSSGTAALREGALRGGRHGGGTH